MATFGYMGSSAVQAFGISANRSMAALCDGSNGTVQLPVDGIVTKLNAYLNATSGDQLKGAIYTNNAGLPNARVAVTPTITLAGGSGQQDLAFSSGVFLTAGIYHLDIFGVNLPGGTNIEYDGGSNLYFVDGDSGGPSDPFPGGGTSLGRVLWLTATYTPAGTIPGPEYEPNRIGLLGHKQAVNRGAFFMSGWQRKRSGLIIPAGA